MANIILVAVLVLMLGWAIRTVYRNKKNGAKCMGCSGSSCCNCSLSQDKRNNS